MIVVLHPSKSGPL
jgi:hypothetical protein